MISKKTKQKSKTWVLHPSFKAHTSPEIELLFIEKDEKVTHDVYWQRHQNRSAPQEQPAVRTPTDTTNTSAVQVVTATTEDG